MCRGVVQVIAVKGYAVIVVEDGAAEELVAKWQQKLAANPAGGRVRVE